MNRREFLWVGAMAAGAAGTGERVLRAEALEDSGWRTYEVTTSINVLKPVGRTRVWLPQPLDGDTVFQKMVSNTVHCEDGKTSPHEDRQTGMRMLEVEFPAGKAAVVTTTQRVSTRNWSVPVEAKLGGERPIPGDAAKFLEATRYVPTTGVVKAKADEITRAAKATTDVEKTRAIYDWVVNNTHRDAKVRGCGVGDIRYMLESGNLGGKCADLNALFVGLAKASGVPARDVYGIRVGPSDMECKSLGASSNRIEKAQHCRAEVYLTGTGWVPMDPADVRKVILEEAPGTLTLADSKVQALEQRLFGSWEMNWMAYNYAQDVVLPGSNGSPLHFFMYPQAETEEGRLDSLDGESFHYEITSREITN